MALDLAEIHQQMLDGIGERYQKTTGFPAYDFTRAFAIAVLSLDSDIAVAEEKLDLENLSGTELDTFIRQHRGLSRKYATYATATLRVVTGGGDIQAGNLFSTASGVEFYAIQDGTYTAGDTFSVCRWRIWQCGAQHDHLYASHHCRHWRGDQRRSRHRGL